MIKKSYLYRLGQIIITLIGVSFLAFLLTHLAPGNPASAMFEAAGIIPTAEELQVAEKMMGLDKPFLEQYINWIGNVFTGDFGQSISKKTDVLQLIVTRLEATLYLAGTAIGIMLLISIPTGI